jgi:hypothetical protein
MLPLVICEDFPTYMPDVGGYIPVPYSLTTSYYSTIQLLTAPTRFAFTTVALIRSLTLTKHCNPNQKPNPNLTR